MNSLPITKSENGFQSNCRKKLRKFGSNNKVVCIFLNEIISDCQYLRSQIELEFRILQETEDDLSENIKKMNRKKKKSIKKRFYLSHFALCTKLSDGFFAEFTTTPLVHFFLEAHCKVGVYSVDNLLK